MLRQLRVYTIRIQGHLSPRWSEWFEDMEIIHSCNGETSLIGTLPDQAALFGLLLKIRDLGLELIAVESKTAQPE
ncbi:MAG: hypothetical protein DCC55_25665 [Chloroflexi bacterium]|nr:MAG: hypothetical protein DCC55_25665 [Chloroflexota bacterium]